MATVPDPGGAYAPFLAEMRALVPEGATVVDAHTHLGRDEDGRALSLAGLLELLDVVAPGTRACVFPLHDPDRDPAYRVPNDRVLAWAQESGGRLIPFCRLDPAQEPVREAERSLANGARGIKLHPRAQAFGFGDPAAEAIFAVARDAGVPILIHAGRGMPTMAPLAELALRNPEVTLILAHAAIADQGLLSTALADHPRVLYDTSCFSALDVVELFARVPAERIVFGSDPPYGRPAGGLFLAMRAARYAGLDARERGLVAGGTVLSLFDGGPGLPAPKPPRLPAVRPVSGRLQRVTGYLTMAFGAMFAGEAPDPRRALPAIALARAACRDGHPGQDGRALARIDAALSASEALLLDAGPAAQTAIGLVHSSLAVATSEPLDGHGAGE